MKYTAAIIGLGRIGFTLGFDELREQPGSHTMALLENDRVLLKYGVDTDEQKRTEWQKYVAGSYTFSCTEELYKNAAPDIVVIAVDETSHLATALDVIAHRPRLVILEKPVALNEKDGDAIKDEAKKNGVPILVNHERRFSLDYKAAKDYLSSIGEITQVNARLDSSLLVYSKAADASGEYSLLHDGTHLIDAVQFLLGEELVEGTIKCAKFDDKKVVRYISVNYSTNSCPDINLVISGKSRYFGFEVDIIGTMGRLRVGNGIFDFQRREQSTLYKGFFSLATDTAIERPKKTRYFSNMVQNAIDFLDGLAPLGSTIETGLEALGVICKIKALLHTQYFDKF